MPGCPFSLLTSRKVERCFLPALDIEAKARCHSSPVQNLNPPEMNESRGDPQGLEASLLNLIHHHHHTSLQLGENAEKAKKEATKGAVIVSDLIVDAVNRRVQEAFINEKLLEMEVRGLATTISRFMRQTDRWLAATHAVNSAMKEIGDFENWMKIMDFDCKRINAAIRDIHQG